MAAACFFNACFVLVGSSDHSTSQSHNAAMICPNCGAENDAGSAFCISCGEKTSLTTEETVSLGSAPAEETAAPAAARQEAETELLETVPQREDALLVAVRGALADDYEVQRELGRGGMAVVYEGVETELRRRVAIKVLPPEQATEDTAERFRREARMAASLDHPNIIPVYRVGQAEGIQFMAMKFVDGRGLDEIVKDQGALPTPVVVRVLADSARALAFAHDNGVIHRDIKGANILIEKDGRVLVTDFGIARAVGDHTMTATGMVMGTPSYMSPEQCGGLKLTHASDQYSLGVLAFQLLSGSLPFEAETFVGLVQHHYMTTPPDIRKVRGDVPDELLSVVYRALAKKPEERFPNTKQMAAALDAVPISAADKAEVDHTLQEMVTGKRVSRVEVEDLPPLVTPMETALAGAAQPKSRMPMIVAGAAVVVAVASAGVAWQAGMFGGRAEPVQQAAPQGPTALLHFDGLPDGAQVYVGGERFLRGSGTVRPESTYTYEIIASGYQTKRGGITIVAGTVDTTLYMRDSLQAVVTETTPQTPTMRTSQPVVMGSIYVRVRDANMQNIAGVTISWGSHEIVEGQAAEVPAGTNTLRLRAPGFVSKDTVVTVSANENLRLPMTLIPEGG